MPFSIGRWWRGLSTGEQIAIGAAGVGAVALGATTGVAVSAAGTGQSGVSVSSNALLSVPWPVRGGYAFTLWSGGPWESAWQSLRTPFAAIRPQVLMPHSGWGAQLTELTPVIAQARQLSPGLRIWGQLACSPNAVQSAIDTAGRFVDRHGAEMVIWNGEAAFRGGGAAAIATKARGARAIIEGFARRYPNVPQGFTSYPRITEYQRTSDGLSYAAWLGGRDIGGDFSAPGLPICRGFGPQTYAIEDNRSTMLPSGVVIRSFNRMLESVGEAERRGLVKPGCGIAAYLSSAWIPKADLIAIGTGGVQVVTQWPWRVSDQQYRHGYDPDGLEAARVIADRFRSL